MHQGAQVSSPGLSTSPWRQGILLDQGVLVVDRSLSRRDQGLAKAYFGLSLIRL